MTRFFVDEREIRPPLDMSSLAQILIHVDDSYLPPDSIIRQIHLDGLPLMPDAFPEDLSRLFKNIENWEKVEIFTGTRIKIAGDSILEGFAYLERIETITPSLAASLRISPGPETLEKLKELCEGFYWLNLLMAKLETNFGINLAEVIVRGLPAQEYQDRFLSILKRLIDAQQRGEFVLVSDLLDYEILPLVPVWKEMFAVSAKQAGLAH